MNPRVLLYCPVLDKPLPETAKAIKRLTFDGSVTIEIGRENPYGKGDYRNVLAQYQHAWDMALDGGYDALLTIEHDIIPPSDALEKLWQAGAPVAYGCYRFRTSNVINLWRYANKHGLDSSLSLFPDDLRRAMSVGVVKVSGVGFGCTLIRKPVLEKIKPRPDDDNGLSVDIAFAKDCLKNDINQLGHFGVMCGHIEKGEILWPFENRQSPLAPVKALMHVNINHYGRTLQLVKGARYDIDAEQAKDLARAGFVEVL